MNGTGESDRPIVPRTLPNKGAAAAAPAEEVEGRGLAKENLLRQNPPIGHRTAPGGQNALERIRQAENVCASDLRQEPYEVIPHVRIRAGGRRATSVPTATMKRQAISPSHLRCAPVAATRRTHSRLSLPGFFLAHEPCAWSVFLLTRCHFAVRVLMLQGVALVVGRKYNRAWRDK